MSSTTFPVSGSFPARKPRAARPVARPVQRTEAAEQAPKRVSRWSHFLGNAFAAWASAGALPVDR